MSERVEATVLGKQVKGKDTYDPGVLVKVPRSENRIQYGIKDDDLPFVGYDVWNCYEVSSMTVNNMPVVGLGKIVYSADSKYIVESKSLKLYLNSFNMSNYGKNTKECLYIIRDIVSRDLSNLLETTVFVSISELETFNYTDVFPRYSKLEDMGDIENIKFDVFNESPSLLTYSDKTTSEKQYCFKTHILRSNCKITNAPDWGTLFVLMNTNKIITPSTFMKYLVSFRKENHFHEEVVEMIFKRFKDAFDPSDLMVSAIYTRRGGIDICPCRSTSYDLIDKNLIDHTIHTTKLDRQ